MLARRDAQPLALTPADLSLQRAISAAGREREGDLSFGTDQGHSRMELDEFLETMPRTRPSFVPSTNIGMFDVELAPPKLILTMRIHFLFFSGDKEKYPDASWRELQWTEEEQRAYRDAWLLSVAEKWSKNSGSTATIRAGRRCR